MELYFLWLTSLAVVNTPQGLSGAGTLRWSPPEEDDYHCIFKGNRRYLHHWSLIMDCVSEVSTNWEFTFCGKRAQAKGTMKSRKQPTPKTWQKCIFPFLFTFPLFRRGEWQTPNLKGAMQSWSRFEPSLLLHVLQMTMMIRGHQYIT